MNFEKDIVNIDLECTGSNKDVYSICEIGAVYLDKKTLQIKGEFESLVRPYKFMNSCNLGEPIVLIDDDAMAVHKIPLETLLRSDETPDIFTVLKKFEDWIEEMSGKSSLKNITLSAWGAYFDIPFLKSAYAYLLRKYPFDRKYLDIKAIVRWEFAIWNSHFHGGLVKCGENLRIKFEGTHHRALDDARQGALILEKLKRQREAQISILESLLNPTKQSFSGYAFKGMSDFGITMTEPTKEEE